MTVGGDWKLEVGGAIGVPFLCYVRYYPISERGWLNCCVNVSVIVRHVVSLFHSLSAWRHHRLQRLYPARDHVTTLITAVIKLQRNGH